MEIQFNISGILLILLALLHIGFPRYFEWNTELKSLQLINRQIMLIHTFFIGLIVFLMGLLCLTSATELIHTPLGKKISLGIGVFWLCRLILQFFGYSSTLWKGKKTETMVHILFSFLWLYFTLVFM